MKTYLAVITGFGEGCDYTIGCNVAVEKYKADNEQQVLDEILDYYGHDCLDYERLEPRIDKVTIYEIPENYIEFTDLAQKHINNCNKYRQELKEKEERKLFEKLKQKYESD